MTFRAFLLAGAAGFAVLASAGVALAQSAPADRPDDAYDLGELVVRDRDGQIVGGAVIRSDDMRRFDKASVDQALDVIPGAAAGSSGGSRNERLVFIAASTGSRPLCRSTGCGCSCRRTIASTSPAS